MQSCDIKPKMVVDYLVVFVKILSQVVVYMSQYFHVWILLMKENVFHFTKKRRPKDLLPMEDVT
jgi:hypothetical protein